MLFGVDLKIPPAFRFDPKAFSTDQSPIKLDLIMTRAQSSPDHAECAVSIINVLHKKANYIN